MKFNEGGFLDMKRKIIALIGIITVGLILTTLSASAKTIYPKWVNEEVEAGRAPEDACGVLAIMALEGDNVPDFIYQNHKNLGSWEKTADYYGVDIEEFNANIKMYKKDIPDTIYNEMKAAGMTDNDCYDFARRSLNAQMDIETTWQAKKNGKTIDDLIKEETKQNNAKLQVAADFAFGKIDEKNFVDKMFSLSPDVTMSDIWDFAVAEKKGWMDFRKAASGITDEELELAAKTGITDFFAACRLKDAEFISNKSFIEMLQQIKTNRDVDEVIRANISNEKINQEIEKNKDLTE